MPTERRNVTVDAEELAAIQLEYWMKREQLELEATALSAIGPTVDEGGSLAPGLKPGKRLTAPPVETPEGTIYVDDPRHPQYQGPPVPQNGHEDAPDVVAFPSIGHEERQPSMIRPAATLADLPQALAHCLSTLDDIGYPVRALTMPDVTTRLLTLVIQL